MATQKRKHTIGANQIITRNISGATAFFFVSQADFHKKKDSEAGNGKVTTLKDFKLALTAVRTTEDLETFHDQFLN